MRDCTAIDALPKQRLTDLFAGDAQRVPQLTITQSGILFDFSKTHLSGEAIAAFEALAGQAELTAKRDDLFAGRVVNASEGRPAEHSAERGEGSAESVAAARALHNRMRALIDAIESDALGPVRYILHVGIGGSALGPDLIVDALAREAGRYEVAIVSNVDGCALEEAFARFDPAATLLVIASKTFTTTETMLNAASVLQWMTDDGVADPLGRVIALTAYPDAAVAWGVDETRVLPFNEAVGGRYSLWSSIGFPIALALGWAGFEELLEGAAEMDRHF
jgi:glucose-6-phosphate isomerase